MKDFIGEEDRIDTNFEFLKQLSEVIQKEQSGMNSDFVMARLVEQDKEGVINRVTNAFLAKELINSYKKMDNWKWDKLKRKWENKKLGGDERSYIEAKAKEVFHIFMVKAYAKVIMNRNVKDNYLIRLLLGKLESQKEEEVQTSEEKEDMKGLKGIMSKVFKKKGNEV